MKDIKYYIIEAKDIHSKWKDVAKKLSKEDKEWIKKYAFDKKSNQIYTMEELEQRMWKGDLKDQIDEARENFKLAKAELKDKKINMDVALGTSKSNYSNPIMNIV